MQSLTSIICQKTRKLGLAFFWGKAKVFRLKGLLPNTLFTANL
jgi:hypothetical protein